MRLNLNSTEESDIKEEYIDGVKVKYRILLYNIYGFVQTEFEN